MPNRKINTHKTHDMTESTHKQKSFQVLWEEINRGYIFYVQWKVTAQRRRMCGHRVSSEYMAQQGTATVHTSDTNLSNCAINALTVLAFMTIFTTHA